MSEVLDVVVIGVFVDELTEGAVVLLAESPLGGRVLPIVVGPSAARSIVVGMSGERATARPFAHDLVLGVVEAVAGYVVRADVVRLVDGTYFGELAIAAHDRTVRLDARPSDCIGVAVRARVPIGVDRHLFDRAAVDIHHDAQNDDARGDHAREGDDGDDAVGGDAMRAAAMGGEERVERIMREFRAFLERADASDFADLSDGGDDL